MDTTSTPSRDYFFHFLLIALPIVAASFVMLINLQEEYALFSDPTLFLAQVSSPSTSNIFNNTFAPDLRNFGSGWSSAHWIPTINRLWTFGGDSHNSAGNNSVRLFDPVGNLWTTAIPNTWGASGCKNTDNYHSFYVPSTDEVWVMAGQGATSQFLCRYGVKTRTWVGLYQTKADAATYIDGIDAWVHAENAAVAYSGARDQALFLGGASNGSPSAILRRIIKNPVDSAKPFRYVQNPWFTGVPPTANARNRMVAVGGSFYVLLGQRLFVSDGATATELAPSPVGGTLSYDSTRGRLVMFGPGGIASYDIATGAWSTKSSIPASQITFSNTMGDYAPPVDYALYTGGYAYRDGVQLTDTTTPTGYQAQFQVVGFRTGTPTTIAPTVTLSANPPTITSGGSATLSWSSTNATLCTASGAWSGTKATSGTQSTEALTTTSTYTLTCVGSGGSATQSVTVTVSAIADTIAPTVSITTPISGVTVSGASVAVSANTSDNIGVVGVQFKLDGTNIGAEDTTSPYGITWNTTLVSNGSHSLTAVARDAAGNQGTSGSVNVTVNNLGIGVIDIPANTWVRIPLPGGGASLTSGKHMRFTWNPVDKRIYHVGGDFYGMSSWPEMYSYGVFDNSWRKEQPMCVTPPNVQHGGADEVTWTYDTRRNIFWMIPGYMHTGTITARCPVGTLAPVDKIMTWDPATKKWSVPARQSLTQFGAISAFHKYGHYDSMTDTIVLMDDSAALSYNITANTWTRYWWTFTDGRTVRVSQEYSVIDAAGRAIYVIDGAASRLYRWGLDSRTMTDLGPTKPATVAFGGGNTRISFDPIHRVILWPQSDTNNISVYHVDTGRWELVTAGNPSGMAPEPSSQTFDPGQNVLFAVDFGLAGGVTGREFLWLYRYGAGSIPVDTQAPAVSITAPASGSTLSGTVVTVSANASDNIGVAGVQFKLDSSNLGVEDTASPYSITWNSTTATNGSHALTAVARDVAGNNTTATAVNVTVSNIATIDTTAPTAPTGLTATAVSSSQINLSWSASTDNVGVTGYRIYRSGTQIATVTTNSYQNTGLTASTLYSYTIAAYDAAGNVSGQSVSRAVTTQTGSVILSNDTIAPTIPQGLTGSAISQSQIALSWTVASDNVAVTGYKISRNGSAIATTPSPSYTDTNLLPRTSYTYTVAAYDLAGNTSNQSGSLSFVTLAGTPPPPTLPALVFVTSPASVVSGGSTNLVWISSGTNSCSASGGPAAGDGASWPGAKGISGSETTGALFSNTTYTLTCTGEGGTVSQSVTIALTETQPLPDTTAPTISISSPSLGMTMIGVFSIEANVSDNIAVLGLQFTLDGNPIGKEVVAPPYTLKWDTRAVQNGPHILSATAHDAAGNSGAGPKVPIMIFNSSIGPQPTDVQTTQPFISQTLSFGSRDPQVKNLQQFLITQGILAQGNDTGYFGPLTHSAVIIFQQRYVIPGTGIVGPLTRAKINELVGASSLPTTQPPTPLNSTIHSSASFNRSLYIGLRGSDVTRLQEFLITKGFLGVGNNTGYFGPLTKDAVRVFQCEQNIVCSGDRASTGWGVVGPSTRTVLNTFK